MHSPELGCRAVLSAGLFRHGSSGPLRPRPVRRRSTEPTAGRCASSSRSSCATACARARLHAGTALPATRALAVELGVARGVVVEAYGQLVAEGFLVARRGSATRVAKVAPAVAAPSAAAGARIPSVRFDLRPESADRGAFPRGAWLAAMRRALADAPDCRPRLRLVGRRAAAAQPCSPRTSARARGVVAQSDNIVVTRRDHAGARAAGRAAARSRRRGACSSRSRASGSTARSCSAPGSRLVPVDVDDDGLRADALPPRRPRSSRPRTSSRPAGSSRRSAAPRCSRGPTPMTPLVHRGRLRRRVPLRPRAARGAPGPRRAAVSPTSVRRARRSRPRCAWAGWSCPAPARARSPTSAAGPTAARRRSISSRSPRSSTAASSIAICGGCACATAAGATGSWRPSTDQLPDHEVGGAAAGLHVTVALAPDADVDAVRGACVRARGRGLRHPACGPPAAPGRLRQHRRGGRRARRPRSGGRRTRLASTACS